MGGRRGLEFGWVWCVMVWEFWGSLGEVWWLWIGRVSVDVGGGRGVVM